MNIIMASLSVPGTAELIQLTKSGQKTFLLLS